MVAIPPSNIDTFTQKNETYIAYMADSVWDQFTAHNVNTAALSNSVSSDLKTKILPKHCFKLSSTHLIHFCDCQINNKYVKSSKGFDHFN